MSAVDGQGVAATVREHGRLTFPLPGCVSARRVRIARPGSRAGDGSDRAPAARAGAHLNARDDHGLTGLMARQEAEETPHHRSLTVLGRGLPVMRGNPLDLSPIGWCSGPFHPQKGDRSNDLSGDN
jgi:hypothetical protein